MTRVRGELSEPEEALLGIERPTEEEEAQAEKDAAEQRELRRRFLVAQMENPRFREWLWDVLVDFGTFENSFGVTPGGMADPMATQHRLGLKEAGWRLWTLFDDAAPDLASAMRRGA